MSGGQWMEAEIGEQPALLSGAKDPYFRRLREMLGGASFDLIVLVARGSSDHAALYSRYLFEIGLEVPVSLAAPSVLTRYGRTVRYPKCLAVGISQSGAAPDASEVIEQLRSDGHTTLAITNHAESRLGWAAEHVLALEAGPERSVAATKTYTASLLALYQTVRALGADLPEPQVPDSPWLDVCSERAGRASGSVLRSNVWFSLSRGVSFASAHETALKLMECSLTPCKAYSTADFQHGPKAIATHGAMAVVYGDVPGGLAEQGCLVEQAPAAAGLDAPIREIVFGQYLALAVARAKGLDPDSPPHLSKVTQTL